MMYEKGRFNLRELNVVMTKVNRVLSEIEVIKEKRIINYNISQLPPAQKRFTSKKEEEGFLNIDIELCGLKAEIELYRENLIKSRLFLNGFKRLKKEHLRSNFFPVKLISNR